MRPVRHQLPIWSFVSASVILGGKLGKEADGPKLAAEAANRRLDASMSFTGANPRARQAARNDQLDLDGARFSKHRHRPTHRTGVEHVRP